MPEKNDFNNSDYYIFLLPIKYKDLNSKGRGFASMDRNIRIRILLCDANQKALQPK